MSFSECNDFRLRCKGTECRCRILQIEHLHVVVIRTVHSLQGRHLLQHGDFYIMTVVLHQFGGDAEPRPIHERADLNERILADLSGNFFYLSRLNIQFSILKQDRPERKFQKVIKKKSSDL